MCRVSKKAATYDLQTIGRLNKKTHTTERDTDGSQRYSTPCSAHLYRQTFFYRTTKPLFFTVREANTSNVIYHE